MWTETEREREGEGAGGAEHATCSDVHTEGCATTKSSTICVLALHNSHYIREQVHVRVYMQPQAGSHVRTHRQR